jgi:vacuolar-type H+-ATPase subunit H
MPEASPAQSTLKRLIEAEDQAREILKAAEDRAQASLAQAREQARQSVETVRLEAARVLGARVEESESKAADQMKQRLEQAEAEGHEIERRAKEHSAQAVALVVDWVTKRGAST